MATPELLANDRAAAFLICPRCGLSIKPRGGWLRVEHCPRCIARARMLVRLFSSALPSGELYREGFAPGSARLAGAQRQDGIDIAEGRPRTQAAIAFATRVHAGQRRADGTPFILHPLEVATRLSLAGAPDHLTAAGVLHDLIEKTDVSASDLRERFGARITELVLAVTDDERIVGDAKRMAALRRQVSGAGEEALNLFAADKLAKLSELRREIATDPGPGSATTGPVGEVRARRLRHYERSLAMLEERQPESPLVRELHDELAAFKRERATPTGTR
jgi:hypothetical protein